MLSTLFDSSQIQVLDLGPECDVFYHPTWLPFKTAIQLFDALESRIPFQQYKVAIADSMIDQPRLTCWFGDNTYTYSGLTIMPTVWLPELQILREKLQSSLRVEFNSALANYYHDGSNYVGWHADDESQIGPVIASVSLGGLREFSIKSAKACYTLELQSGSLLVMAGQTQKHCRHMIHKTARRVEPRINLTFRQFKIRP